MPSAVAALRLPRTSLRRYRRYLFPFAMWAAFPSADYYGNSVALGLAPVRRSRAYWLCDVSSVG